MVKWGVLLADW